MRTPALLLLPCLFLPLGCASYSAEHRELVIREHAADDIYREVVRYASSRGYRADPAETDPSRRVFTSGWRGGGVPIAGRIGGRRHRLFAEVVRPRSSETGWVVRYYFEVQRVGDVGRGLNPDEDDWEAAGQDVGREQQFAYALRYTLMGENRNLRVQQLPSGIR